MGLVVSASPARLKQQIWTKWAGVGAQGSNKSTTGCHHSALALVFLESHLLPEHLQQKEEKLTGGPGTSPWDLELDFRTEEVVYSQSERLRAAKRKPMEKKLLCFRGRRRD